MTSVSLSWTLLLAALFVMTKHLASTYGAPCHNDYTPKRVIRYISPRDLCNDRSAQRRTGIGYFINPLIFSLNKPKTCNREKKTKLNL